MIIVRFRSFDENGKMKVFIPPELKFPNDYNFKFDIRNKNEWKKFLDKYPKSVDGKTIYRDVYIFGNLPGETKDKKIDKVLYNEYRDYKKGCEK